MLKSHGNEPSNEDAARRLVALPLYVQVAIQVDVLMCHDLRVHGVVCEHILSSIHAIIYECTAQCVSMHSVEFMP